MVDIKFINDLVEFNDFELDSKGMKFEFYSYGKVKEIEYIGDSSQIKQITIIKYLDIQSYLNSGLGFQVEKVFTNSSIPPQIRIIIDNRELFGGKGFVKRDGN